MYIALKLKNDVALINICWQRSFAFFNKICNYFFTLHVFQKTDAIKRSEYEVIEGGKVIIVGTVLCSHFGITMMQTKK